MLTHTSPCARAIPDRAIIAASIMVVIPSTASLLLNNTSSLFLPYQGAELVSPAHPVDHHYHGSKRRGLGASTEWPIIGRRLRVANFLELARIGSQLFVFGSSTCDQTAASPLFETFATRLSAQPLRGQDPRSGYVLSSTPFRPM